MTAEALSPDILLAITGTLALVTAFALGVGGWRRRHAATPAGLAMTASAAVWMLRYGLRLLDGSDGHLSRIGTVLADSRLLVVSIALLAVSALLYAIERGDT